MLKIERKRRNWICPLVWLWLVFIVLAVLTGLFVAKDITFMGDTLKSQLPADFVVNSKWGGWIALGSFSLFPWLFFISYSCIKEKSVKKNKKEGKGLEATLGIIFAILLLAGIAVSGLNFGDFSYSLDALKTSSIFLGVSVVPALVIVLIIGIITYLIVARVFYKKDLLVWAEARIKELEEEEAQRIANESKVIEEEKKAEPAIQETPVENKAAPTAQENDFDRRIINALNPAEENKEEKIEETQEGTEVVEEKSSDKTPDYWYGKNEAEAQPVKEAKVEETPAQETKEVTEAQPEEKASDKTPDYWYGKNEAEAQPVETVETEEKPVSEEAKVEQPETPVTEETKPEETQEETKTEEPATEAKNEEQPVETAKVEEVISENEPIPASEILADGLYLRDSHGKVITFAQPTNNNTRYYAFAKIHQGRLDLFKVTDGVEKRIPEPVDNHGYTLQGAAREIIQIQNGLSNINYSDKSIYSFINKDTKLVFVGDENKEYEINITIYDNASSGDNNDRWIALSIK